MLAALSQAIEFSVICCATFCGNQMDFQHLPLALLLRQHYIYLFKRLCCLSQHRTLAHVILPVYNHPLDISLVPYLDLLLG